MRQQFRGMWRDMRVTTHDAHPRQDEGRDEVVDVLKLCEIHIVGGAGDVRDHDASCPFRYPLSLVVAKPAPEEGGNEGRGNVEHIVEVAEREVREHDLRLVLEQICERLVPTDPQGRLVHSGHEHVFDVRRLTHPHCQRGEEARQLGVHDCSQQRLFASGKRPVDGGSATSGLSGDIVERRLGYALTTDAPQGSVDQTDALSSERRCFSGTRGRAATQNGCVCGAHPLPVKELEPGSACHQ